MSSSRLIIAHSFTHKQATPSAQWNIKHNCGYFPAVDVLINYDGQLQKIIPLEITHIDAYNSQVTFSLPQSGKAICN